MNLSSLTAADLNRISKLIASKEALQAKIQQIDHALAAFEGSDSPKPGKAGGRIGAAMPAKALKTKRQKRGQLKASIINLLKSVGKGGLRVKEIATRLKTKYGSVSVWFNTTGKSVKEIKKVGPARYEWSA